MKFQLEIKFQPKLKYQRAPRWSLSPKRNSNTKMLFQPKKWKLQPKMKSCCSEEWGWHLIVKLSGLLQNLGHSLATDCIWKSEAICSENVFLFKWVLPVIVNFLFALEILMETKEWGTALSSRLDCTTLHTEAREVSANTYKYRNWKHWIYQKLIRI